MPPPLDLNAVPLLQPLVSEISMLVFAVYELWMDERTSSPQSSVSRHVPTRRLPICSMVIQSCYRDRRHARNVDSRKDLRKCPTLIG
jgi:hypothetical protein